jgi:hypothetical protein
MFEWLKHRKKESAKDRQVIQEGAHIQAGAPEQMTDQPETDCPQEEGMVTAVPVNEEARQLVDDLDQALRRGEMKIVCSRCKGTSWRYLSLYGLYQCTTPWCGNLRGGIQISPPHDPKAR